MLAYSLGRLARWTRGRESTHRLAIIQTVDSVLCNQIVLRLYASAVCRVLEEEYSEIAACVMRRSSMVEPEQFDEDVCPICNSTELTGDNLNVCTDCETFACLDCGAYETNLTTQVTSTKPSNDYCM